METFTPFEWLIIAVIALFLLDLFGSRKVVVVEQTPNLAVIILLSLFIGWICTPIAEENTPKTKEESFAIYIDHLNHDELEYFEHKFCRNHRCASHFDEERPRSGRLAIGIFKSEEEAREFIRHNPELRIAGAKPKKIPLP